MSKYRDTQAPCLDCTNRHSGCHGKCDRYISFTHKREELKKLKEKARLCEPPHRKGE